MDAFEQLVSEILWMEGGRDNLLWVVECKSISILAASRYERLTSTSHAQIAEFATT
jgi:hypothetical protein